MLGFGIRSTKQNGSAKSGLGLSAANEERVGYLLCLVLESASAILLMWSGEDLPSLNIISESPEWLLLVAIEGE
jgi:hypothetical protein